MITITQTPNTISCTSAQIIDESRHENYFDILIASALANKNIKCAKCFEIDDTYVVSAITTPFYLKSERDKCLQTLTTLLSQLVQRQVYVSFDVDVYRNIKENMTDKQKQALFERVVSRLSKQSISKPF